jgi:hypothetical protein
LGYLRTLRSFGEKESFSVRGIWARAACWERVDEDMVLYLEGK